MVRKVFHFIIVLLMIASYAFAEGEYGLKVWDKAPDFSAIDIDGNKIEMNSALRKGPVVLIFYRGGWDPFSTEQLKGFEENLITVADKYDAKIIAVSIDKFSESRKTKDNNRLTFNMISDPDVKIITDYKVRERLHDEMMDRFTYVYEIDIEAYSGKTHHFLAMPAVYVIDTEGTIVYAYANKDYKIRAGIKEIKRAILKAGMAMKPKR